MWDNFLIIGGGVAGMSAAAKVRTLNASASITILSQENEGFYTRIRIPDYVAGKVERNRLVLPAQKWAEQNGIKRLQGVTATSLDTVAHQVTTGDGQTFIYDRLLLATGALCNIPPLKGVELKGVVGVRTLQDADTLRDELGTLRGKEDGDRGRVVVVGGGVLGIELAAAINSLGPEVVVVEPYQWLLNRQLDRDGGDVLKVALEKTGLLFRLGVGVEELLGENGRVTGVKLYGDGDVLPCSVVVIAAGVHADVELARSAGIQVNRGIVIDNGMKTSADDVFAAGDCAEYQGRSYGLWSVADEQGKLAGAALCGEEVNYQGSVPGVNLKVIGVGIMSAGRIEPGRGEYAKVSSGAGTYKKLVYNEQDRLVGAVLVGDLTEQRAILKELNSDE